MNYEDVFVDGTKIEAAANHYTFVWKKAVEKNEGKILLKVQALVDEFLKLYHAESTVAKETINDDMAKMAAFWGRRKRMKILTLYMAAVSAKAIYKNG